MAEYLRHLSRRVRPGETISGILDWAGVSPRQIEEWVRATNHVHNLNRIRAGQEVSLLVDTRSSTLHHLVLEIDPEHFLVAERQESGVVATWKPIEHDWRLQVRGGTVDSSLYAAAVAQGIPEKIVAEIADILGWELDLATDLRPGARFRVVYEERIRPGRSPVSIPGRVLAAEIANAERIHEVFYFAMPDGSQAGYYTRAGETVGRAFLRYPVSFTRISSRFSQSRFHPVLKRPRPHYGVDFVAATGTPVKAIADGTVRKAGWNGGYGRFVQIGHDTTYGSGYAHLSRIAPGIRAGARVTKGQVIGYVGSSGRATGSHLHFEMYRRGRYMNPLAANLPREPALSSDALAAFRRAVEAIDRTYAQAGAGVEHLAQLPTGAATVAQR